MKKHSLYIYGKNPVNELFSDQPELIRRLYVKDNMDQKDFEHVRKAIRPYKTPLIKVHAKKMEDLVGDVSHQGIVAEIKEFPYTDFDAWPQDVDTEDNPLVLLLNEITDPHNVGAIIRSAVGFGVSAIILPTHNQAGVTGVVYKTSAGTAHKIPIIRVGNTNRTLEKLKNSKFWIAGLEAVGDKKLHEEEFDTPTVVVIGSEGSGMRLKTKEACDYTISIPMNKKLESLNASVSASLVGYEYYKKKISR